MDKSQNLPHVLMDTSSTVPTQVSGQTSTTVSLDTDALIAVHQGAAWKISGWPENIAIHHAKGVLVVMSTAITCLGLRVLGKSTYSVSTLRMLYRVPGPCSSTALKLMPINAYKGKSVICMRRSMNLRMLFVMRRSYCNAEAALTKEHSWVKDVEQELKDLKSCSQSEMNTSTLLPTTLATVEPKSQVVIPAWCQGNPRVP